MRPQRIDPDWLSFLSRFIWKVFPFKSYSFFYSFSSCPTSLSKTALMSLNWETAFKQEITRWRLRWSIRPPDIPFQFQRLLWNHLIKPCRFLCSKTFLTYPISAGVRCWAQFHGSIAMKRIKTSLRNKMTDERLSSLSILHTYNVVNVTKFTQQKGRLLALCL